METLKPFDFNKWKKVGFKHEDRAKEWWELGFKPSEAIEWEDVGYEPSEAEEWSNRGFDLDDANKWVAYDLSPELAEKYIEKGMKPFEVKEEKEKIKKIFGINIEKALYLKQKELSPIEIILLSSGYSRNFKRDFILELNTGDFIVRKDYEGRLGFNLSDKNGKDLYYFTIDDDYTYIDHTNDKDKTKSYLINADTDNFVGFKQDLPELYKAIHKKLKKEDFKFKGTKEELTDYEGYLLDIEFKDLKTSYSLPKLYIFSPIKVEKGGKDPLFHIIIIQNISNPKGVNTILLKSGHLLSKTYVIRKKDFPCENGYVEVIALLDKKDNKNEITIDICADESDLYKDRFSLKKLNQVLTENPEKIIDLYIWEDASELFEEQGFKLRKRRDRLFRNLDKEIAINLFKEGEVKIEYIYQN